MDTQIFKPTQDSIKSACDIIKNGGVVAIPTETVYGLFADATKSEACANIFTAKDRPQDNPLIVHISDYDMLKRVALEIPEDAIKLAEAFWPGPLTIILKKTELIPDTTSAGLDTVGIRMPSHPVVLEIISKTGLPLAGPSANRSGRPSPTDAQTVYNDMTGRIPLVLDGGDCNIGVESTVVSLAGDQPVLFRPGYITKAQMEDVLHKEVILSKGITEELSQGEKVLSPGLKHKHYAPKADVIIVNAEFDKYKQLVEDENATALCFDEYADKLNVSSVCYGSVKDSASQAVRLFQALRELDEIGAGRVYAMMPSTEDVGLAVYNRLLRAAAFRVVNL
ncbi:MAG: threonylcarbamoyl-AMP synthase [Oscillospiraceae bacterium]|nr:threonylcarbamoyl-AMP synthase [Oscillospiraceae bacterium]